MNPDYCWITDDRNMIERDARLFWQDPPEIKNIYTQLEQQQQQQQRFSMVYNMCYNDPLPPGWLIKNKRAEFMGKSANWHEKQKEADMIRE